jgi:hypothetical protein
VHARRVNEDKTKEEAIRSADRGNKANVGRQGRIAKRHEDLDASKAERLNQEGIEKSQRLQRLLSQKRPDLFEAEPQTESNR